MDRRGYLPRPAGRLGPGAGGKELTSAGRKGAILFYNYNGALGKARRSYAAAPSCIQSGGVVKLC